jgi:hypothetical protein
MKLQRSDKSHTVLNIVIIHLLHVRYLSRQADISNHQEWSLTFNLRDGWRKITKHKLFLCCDFSYFMETVINIITLMNCETVKFEVLMA